MEVPKIRHDIENNFDIAFQVFSAQISDDYLAILKTKVHPIYSHLDKITLREVRVLICLWFFDGPLSPKMIAKFMRFDPATVTRSIANLHEKKLVTIVENPKDTRGKLVAVTKSGEAFAGKCHNSFQGEFELIATDPQLELTLEEQRVAVKVMQKLRDRTQIMRKNIA